MSKENKKPILNISELNGNLEDFNSVLICAIRYCLGRRTYMPSLVTSFIKINCENLLSKKTISIMKDDIASCSDYGNECDMKTWMEFYSWLKKEYEKVE